MVFVCTANSARSQLAAATWNSVSTIPATSAGTHPARHVHPRAIAVARRHGLGLENAVPISIQDVLRGGDQLIVAVCDNAHEELDPDCPGCTGRFPTLFAEAARHPSRTPTPKSMTGYATYR